MTNSPSGRTVRAILDLLASGQNVNGNLLAGNPDAEVVDVLLIEQLAHVDRATPGALLVLDTPASQLANSYLFDVAVRRAHAQGATAVLFAASENEVISITAVALCDKTGLALIRVGTAVNLMSLLRSMAAALTGALNLTAERARTALAALASAPTSTAPEAIVELGSRLLGQHVRLVPADEVDPAVSISVPASILDDRDEVLAIDRSGAADADALAEMMLWRLAIETTRLAQRELRSRQLTRLSSSEILLQLVESDRAGRSASAAVARRIGIPIDAWHVAVHLQLDNLRDLVDSDLTAFEYRGRLAETLLDAAESSEGRWHVAQAPSALIAVVSRPDPFTRGDSVGLPSTVDGLIAELASALPGLIVYGGVGTARAGLDGLSLSAAEARLAASSSKTRHRVNTATSFDLLGMRSSLVEWYSSPAVQESIDTLLAPMLALSEAKQAVFLDTLVTYLDANGSVSDTAAALHLHRNAVRYRLQRAFEVLAVDESDSDQRLFLHLALKARRPLASQSRAR